MHAPTFLSQIEELVGDLGIIEGQYKQDVHRIIDKIQEKMRKGDDDLPIARIYDSIRCSVTVDSPAKLERAVDIILKDREGLVFQVKPKLND